MIDKEKKKRVIFDIVIGIQLITYIFLTTFIFITHKKIIRLEKKLNTPKKVVKEHFTNPKNNTDKTTLTLNKQTQQNPKNAKDHFDLGMALMSQTGQEDKAIFHLNKVLELDQEHPNKEAIEQWLRELQKKVVVTKNKLHKELDKLKKFVENNPNHFLVPHKKKQILIIKNRIETITKGSK